MTPPLVDVLIETRDPIIIRDGRPFGADSGFRMKALPWPYPSTTAGAARTLAGKLQGGVFDETMVNTLLAANVWGPFPAAKNKRGEWELRFGQPKDLISSPRGSLYSLRPAPGGALGVNYPYSWLRPLNLVDPPDEDFKPAPLPLWWTLEQMESWLRDDSTKLVFGHSQLKEAPTPDIRVHVQIQSDTGAAQDERLFQTTGLSMPDHWRIAARIDSGSLPSNETQVSPVGGERRFAIWETGTAVSGWTCPESVSALLKDARCVRMVLATPAIFANGWRPGWVDEEGKGRIPGTDCDVQLVAAIIDRWQAVSGYSYDERHKGKREKPVRRLVPAGSVYFFRLLHESGAMEANTVWMKPVSDDAQASRDGFGLAVWGVWSEVKG